MNGVIEHAATRVPAVHNTQRWSFVVTPSRRVLERAGREHPQTVLRIGYGEQATPTPHHTIADIFRYASGEVPR